MIYDLIIIGGGPAGYIAGERAGAMGKSVLLIEKDSLGGVCLNEGCIPTKTLLYSAKINNMVKDAKKYGVDVGEAKLNHKKALARKKKTIKKLCAGIKITLGECGVEIINGCGYIYNQATDGFVVAVDDDKYTGKNILVATGSSSIVLPIDGIEQTMESGFALTNAQVLALNEVPQKMVIIGGGVIGLEIAGYYRSTGSDIVIIEMLDTIGGKIDKDIAEILQREYEKLGIEFVLRAKACKIAQGEVHYEKDGQTHIVECDKVLMSVGRYANINGLGLEDIGVKMDKGIKVDDMMQTNIEGIYAAGDVTAKSMLAHTAYRQAEVAANNILGKKDTMKYGAIPSVIYTNPEVASVGVTKEIADKMGMNVIEKSISMNYSGRYMAENEAGQGIAKVIVDIDSKALVGVHIVGSYASEIIYGAGIMIDQKMTIDEIKKQIFPHPTVTEIIREAIFQIEL